MKTDVCILIPIYKIDISEIEMFSLKRMLHVFSNRTIFFIGPQKLDKQLKTLINKFNKTNISLITFDDIFFKNTKQYNRLLLNVKFYKSFDKFEYLVICQLDVLVLKDDIDKWILKNIDNIGAPLFENYTKVDYNSNMRTVGANGGFCMRKIDKSIDILKSIKCKYSPINILWNMENSFLMKLFRVIRDGFIFNYNIPLLRPIINEDVFWSIIVPQRFKKYRTVTPSEAASFSFDANPRYLYNKFCENQLPMAIHAWWRYDKEFALQLLNQIKDNNEHP